jgi:hypothetical protein
MTKEEKPLPLHARLALLFGILLAVAAGLYLAYFAFYSFFAWLLVDGLGGMLVPFFYHGPG